jgi:ribonucleoside-diphosphate reductase alpha chain
MDKKDYPDYVDSRDLETRIGEAGIAMMEKKYLPSKDGIFQKPAHRIYDVASVIAGVEEQYGADSNKVEEYTKEFYEMMSNLDFLPGGRILANAGTEIKALANCYVLPVEDDLGEIYQTVKDAAIIHKNGGGTGYNFSQLRPRGWTVKTGIASGPVSFAGQYDRETEIINSGNRRGANMGILNIDHLDILEFIRAKDITGVLTNFNISVGITDEFMKAYKSAGEYHLKFNGKPIKKSDVLNIFENCKRMKAGSDIGEKPIPPSIQIRGEEVWNVYPDVEVIRPDIRVLKYNEDGAVLTKEELIGRVDDNDNILIKAEFPFKLIAKYAHSRGDPGLIFLDFLEKDNLLPSEGRLDTTNPCGEQPLHHYGACDLGSINLKNFVTEEKEIDYERLEKIVRYGVRFLDNVNDLSEGPIPKIKEKMVRHRRIGLGVMGWADMLMRLNISYDSKKAYDLAEKVMSTINNISMEESLNLAKEKGPFPDFDKSLYDQEKPVRNLARTTIAPTGSISMVADVNSGIEPWYALIYWKKMRGGDEIEVANNEFKSALREANINEKKIEEIICKVKENGGSCSGIEEVPKSIQKVFKVSKDINYKSHIQMQSRFQKHVDNAISKTINFSSNATIKDILNAYELAHSLRCKGITIYRDGSLESQVLNVSENKDPIANKRNLRLKLVEEELSKKRPKKVMGETIGQQTPYNHKAFVTLNSALDENGDGSYYYETFFQVGRSGGDLPALSEGLGRVASLALKAGVNPRHIAEQLIDIGGETQSGIGPEKVKSLPDAFGKALGKMIPSDQEEDKISSPKENNEKSKKHSGNLCPKCAKPLIMQEGCQKCICGYSKC